MILAMDSSHEEPELSTQDSTGICSILGFIRSKWRSWVLLNASWSSRWWYATVHVITATVGAGVLSLHTTLEDLTWHSGITFLVVFLALSLVCYSIIIKLHETVPGRRFDRYSELSQYVFGKNLGFWLLLPLQVTVQIVVDIIYIITAASSLKKLFDLASTQNCSSGGPLHQKLWPWSLIFGAIQLVLSQLPDFTSLTWTSSIAATTSIGYSTLAWIAAIPQVRYHSKPFKQYSLLPQAFKIFKSIGTIAFACSTGQNIALEIQATIPSSPERPSKVPMWRGVLMAYFIIAICYIPVAISGYIAYSPASSDIRLLSCLCLDRFDCHLLLALERPKGLLVAANLMIVLHMCGSYQVYAMPLFDNMETLFYNKLTARHGLAVRMAIRSSYVAFTVLVATAVPFFVRGFELIVTGFAIIPVSYLIPSLMWHLTHKPPILSIQCLGSMACLVIESVVAVISTIGGIAELHYTAGLSRKFP